MFQVSMRISGASAILPGDQKDSNGFQPFSISLWVKILDYPRPMEVTKNGDPPKWLVHTVYDGKPISKSIFIMFIISKSISKMVSS